MTTKYLTKDEIKPGVLIKVASYQTNEMIPALVLRIEATGSGALYVRAVDSEGESFLANPDFLEPFNAIERT
jgi:hypothetical protein